MLRTLNVDMSEVIGAGFVDMEEMTCIGESVSIEAKATTQCTSILRSASNYNNWKSISVK
jgi:hypothetical protein